MNCKAVILLPDGMADEPLPELGGKTPLEFAPTPGMDSIAARGASGTFLTLPEGLPTSSDVANMSVLGFRPELNYPGRGPIECAGQGIELGPDDVAFRCNLVYASEDGVLRDYSAGHIDEKESRLLMEDLEKNFGSAEATFHAGVSYRNLLVLHGRRFSPAVRYFKPDSSADMPLAELQSSPSDDSPEAAATVAFLHDLEERCAAFLSAHPLNRGKSAPANRIWPWSPGRKPVIPPFSELYQGRTGAVITAVDVIKGIAKCTGMDVIEVPGATGFVDTNYKGKLEAALGALEDHDLVYLHVEAVDECSHIGDLELKLRAIADFDREIVSPLLEALAGRNDVNVAVLPDHPVPLRLRKHTTTPVPLAIRGPAVPVPDGIDVFSEIRAKEGTLGFLRAGQLVRKILGLEG
ncbi:MAG: cofactor-independent phosphoglycerate mutase [Lentisphaeria bacterium]|nr:cofactor-independent phosphoglycerate mutase [Lentisphaeria bacterium]